MTQDTDTTGRTGRLVRWLKDKIEKRRDERDDHDPWWVTLMLDLGRPVVAIMILVMCAPGEHYLMLQARFHDPFAWLGPATLTAYAGIAAVTATKRPKGAPGHSTAVIGAVLSIAIAMAAQPIAHLWGTSGLTRDHIWLIIVVSSVPSAVFGHLLHMGAAPTAKRRTPARRTADRKPDTPETSVRTAPDKPAPVWVTEAKVSRTLSGEIPGQAPDSRTDTAPDMPRTQDIGTGSLSADVRTFLTDNPDASNDDLYAAMRPAWPDKPDNSFYVARKRFERSRTA